MNNIQLNELLPMVRKQWNVLNIEESHSALFFIFRGPNAVIPSQLAIASDKLTDLEGFTQRTSEKFISRQLIPSWIVFIDSPNNKLSAVTIETEEIITEALSSNVMNADTSSRDVVLKFSQLLKEHVKNV